MRTAARAASSGPARAAIAPIALISSRAAATPVPSATAAAGAPKEAAGVGAGGSCTFAGSG